jgi:hypothetical protein
MTVLPQFDDDSRKPPHPRHVAFSIGNSKGLIRTLESLGFDLPQTIHSLAAAGEPLGKAGKIDVHELDRQLKQCALRTEQRIQLKAALIRQGLL